MYLSLPHHTHGLVHNIIALVAVFYYNGASAAETESCQVAQNRCISRMGCSLTLNNYFLDCGSLLHGETSECSPRCRKSLISLLSTDDQQGMALMHCDCDGNDFCETHKNRIQPCSKDVLAAMKTIYDDTTEISCSLAEQICRADSPCLKALHYYEGHCSRMWRGEKCTSRCNNSIDILYRQPKARKLRTCVCDGTEDFPVPCRVLKDNTERLCYQKRDHGNDRVGLRARHRHHRNQTHHDVGDYGVDTNVAEGLTQTTGTSQAGPNIVHSTSSLTVMALSLLLTLLCSNWRTSS